MLGDSFFYLKSISLFLLMSTQTMFAEVCDNDIDPIRVGKSKVDVTGPIVESGLYGYAMPQQISKGLHMRTWSRAFVFERKCEDKLLAIAIADALMISQGIKLEVVKQLKDHFNDARFSDSNVMLAATHTHAAPGNYSHYTLYQYLFRGFSEVTFKVLAKGISQSIINAYENRQAAQLSLGSGELFGTSVNRSPLAYEQNPEEERALFSEDTDKEMVLLRIEDKQGGALGLINWFAVHGTSMGNTNHLVSPDNKGYGAFVTEKYFNDAGARAFVASFAQGAAGDVSPNIFGGTNGGGKDDFESTAISGTRQSDAAIKIWKQTDVMNDPVLDYRHIYLKFDELQVDPHYTGMQKVEKTCPAALGISMLAGAEDGPGIGKEGIACNDNSGFFLKISCRFFVTACQAEKHIGLSLGTKRPNPWTPNILPLQIFRIGELAIVALPFEVTTMSSRRIKATIAKDFAPLGVNHLVVAGYANAYSGYLTTREEYSVQHYEGASNHFGPWTLAAIQQEVQKLGKAMIKGQTTISSLEPKDMSGTVRDIPLFLAGDKVPKGSFFGDFVSIKRNRFLPGETVLATFWSGNLALGAGQIDDFMAVDNYDLKTKKWVKIAGDDDPSTKIYWHRVICGASLHCSQASLEWQIPRDIMPGKYRLRHFGLAQTSSTASPESYEGRVYFTVE